VCVFNNDHRGCASAPCSPIHRADGCDVYFAPKPKKRKMWTRIQALERLITKSTEKLRVLREEFSGPQKPKGPNA